MATVIWKDGIPHTSNISVQVDEVGVATVTQEVACETAAMANSVITRDATTCPVPIADTMVISGGANRLEGGLWSATIVFRGLLDPDIVGQYIIHSCKTVVNKEPIQTHPHFDTFAGKPYASKNGAFFNLQNGEFERFLPFLSDGKKNPKSGVTDYWCPIVTFTEVKLIVADDLAAYVEKLGFVDNDMPTCNFRPVYTKRNWLLTKCEPEWVSLTAYRLTREWALSGPRGWHNKIYPQ